MTRVVTAVDASPTLRASDLSDEFESLAPLIEGRVAIVTGATRGIGRALALYYAKLGADVAVDGRSPDLVDEVAREAKGLRGRIIGIAGDVHDPSHREELVGTARHELGPVDILVNNAGVIAEISLSEMTHEEWRHVLSVNLDAVFAMTQLVGVRSMLPRGRGKIINFSSILGTTALAGSNSYAASKGAVEQLTRGFALEWAGRGVNVNAVAPGYVKTQMNHAYRSDPRARKLMLGGIPARRFGELEDIVGPVLFLSTSLSDYCHGTILVVDGGYLCR